MENFDKRLSKEHPWTTGGSHKKPDTLRAEKKAALLATLKVLVDKERLADPNFNITTGFIQKSINANKDLFFGIQGSRGVVDYFSNDMNFLREQLGLPIKISKNTDW